MLDFEKIIEIDAAIIHADPIWSGLAIRNHGIANNASEYFIMVGDFCEDCAQQKSENFEKLGR